MAFSLLSLVSERAEVICWCPTPVLSLACVSLIPITVAPRTTRQAATRMWSQTRQNNLHEADNDRVLLYVGEWSVYVAVLCYIRACHDVLSHMYTCI